MCQPASMLITKKRVIWSMQNDSHEAMRMEHDLCENGSRSRILSVGVELNPPDGDFSRPSDEWRFRVDQDLLPDWWNADDAEYRARRELDKWIAARVIQPGERRDVRSGFYYALPGSIVAACGNSNVTAYGDSKVTAHADSVIIAGDTCSVIAYDHSYTVAIDDSSVVAYEDSIVMAWGRSRVTAHDSSVINARDSANVNARDDSIVTAHDQSVVVALDRSTVISYDERVSVDTSQSDKAVAVYRWGKKDPKVHIAGKETKVS